MRKKHKNKISCAQQHSKMSNGRLSRGPMGRIESMGPKPVMKNRLPQRHSKMSNGRLSGSLCWPHGGRLSASLNSCAQRDSPAIAGSNLGILGSLGILGKRHKIKNTLPKQHSKMSNGRLSVLLCWPHGGRLSVSLNSCAQRDSRMSNFREGEHFHRESAKNTQRKGISTMLIKNIGRCFMAGWGNKPMSKKQNTLPQRDSKMSILKIETENSLPQRHSKMSIFREGNIFTQRAQRTHKGRNLYYVNKEYGGMVYGKTKE